MKKLLFALPVVLFLAAGCNSSQPVAEQTQPTPTVQPTTSPTPTPSEQADWHNYQNTQYGFKFTFPNDSWKGYKVFQRKMLGDDNTIVLDFAVPTNNKAYSLTEDNSNGFAAPFLIAIMTKAQWAKISREEGPKPAFITQNSQRVFTYFQWQDSPTDLQNVNFAVPQLVKSFQLMDSQTSNTNWKDTVYAQFKNLTAWDKEETIGEWIFADYTYETQRRSQLKKYGTGKILLLHKSFNGNGCQSDCSAEGIAQNNLIASIKTSLSQNGWSPVSWPTEPSAYTDYLYVKDGHPLILQIGGRDGVKGGEYVDIEFQY